MLLVFVRGGIGATFLASAALKFVSRQEFVESLPIFGVPGRLSRGVAATIVLIEIAVSVSMAVGGSLLLPGLVIAGVLLISFSAVLVRVLVRRIDTSCHCFGRSSTPVSRADLIRNGGFLALVASGLAIAVRMPAANVWLPKAMLISATPPISLVALAAGVSFALIWSQLPEVFRLFSGDNDGIHPM